MRLIDADYILHKMDTTDLQPRTETEHYAFGFAKEILQNAPTVEAEPVKHGKWLETRDSNKKLCSNCGVIHFIAQYPCGTINYCPNCGAILEPPKRKNII